MIIVVVAAALALVIGTVLGLLGGGGAILTVPMLVYALGLEPKTAIATSLFVVGTTSIIGTAVHARAGGVRWKVGATFGLAAMAGAYSGGQLAHLIPSSVLLVLFGITMLITAAAMLKKGGGPKSRRSDDPDVALATNASASPPPVRLGRSLALGAGVGILSGLVGAGGGFLIVPALTLFGGLAIREAIGTSLFIIALQSFAGFGGHITHVHLDWALVLVITFTSVIGSVVGGTFGAKISPNRLRWAFAWLVIAMGLFLFVKEVPLMLSALNARSS